MQLAGGLSPFPRTGCFRKALELSCNHGPWARAKSLGTIHRAHLITITGNHLLPRPARNERGEGWGEGHPVELASSPQPSPPVGEEREPISSGCLVVVIRCAPIHREDAEVRAVRLKLIGRLLPVRAIRVIRG